MTLSLKQKAMLITAGIIASAFAGSLLVAFIVANVSAETIGYVCGIGFCSWFVYLFYAITLNRLEYQESLKKLSETIKG